MFNEGSLFSRIFSFLGQLVAWNLLWILCSVPIITAGASTTALFYCTLKLHKDGDCRTFRDFFKSFRQNFIQATIVWLLLILVGALLYSEKNIIKMMPGIMPVVFSYLMLAICIPLIMIALYIFPTIAAFDNKISKLITNALYFSIKKIIYTILIAVITIAPMFFTLVDAQLFPVYLFIWLLCGFSLTAYADSWFIWKIIKPYFAESEKPGKFQDTETDRYVF